MVLEYGDPAKPAARISIKLSATARCLSRHLRTNKEGTMRPFLAFGAAAGLTALVAWMVIAPPKKTALTMETSRSLNAAPDWRLVTERSPYMRTER
jgi:hypothetical protein